jgi:phage tail sheath gpL-like
MASGSGAPDFAGAFANLADAEFDFVCCPYTDATALTAMKNSWDDVTGRWSWQRQLYGHVFSAKRGSVAQLQTFGVANNNQHATFIGIYASPSPVWEWAAAWCAQAAVSLRNDPARPLQTLPLVGILAAPLANRFLTSEKQTLLFSGVATHYVGTDGVVRIERSITSYQFNVWNQPDPSYLDVETLYTLAYVLRFLRNAITTKFGRSKLANDGTRFGLGQAIVTPKVVRAELIAQYSALEAAGVVENIDAFKANLVVERNAGDPNRLDILYTPDLVNQLRIFAVLAQFRLQYPTA